MNAAGQETRQTAVIFIKGAFGETYLYARLRFYLTQIFVGNSIWKPTVGRLRMKLADIGKCLIEVRRSE